MSNNKSNGSNAGHQKNHQKISRLVAIDSNVFIDLSSEMAGHRQDINTVTNNFYDRLAVIRKLAEKGKLRFIITPTVLQEITSHGFKPNELRFMQKYCYVLQPKDKVEFAKKVSKLMHTYVSTGIMPVGRRHPYGDAMIMAEATIAGVNLLTNNYRDFIVFEEELDAYKKDKLGDLVPKHGYSDSMIPRTMFNLSKKGLLGYMERKGRYRALNIGDINNQMHYSYQNRRGYVITPMPFTTMDFIGKESEEQGLWNSEQFMTNFNNREMTLNAYENDQ